jgi:hypothetical protein
MPMPLSILDRRQLAKLAAKTLLLLPIVAVRSNAASSENAAVAQSHAYSYPSVQQPPDTGPTASSSFITADFTSAMNYSGGGSSQQIISQRLWGTSTGGAGDDQFRIFTNSRYTSLMGQANPGIWYFVGNLSGAWFNNDCSVNPSAWSNLINNFYKVDPLRIAGILIGLDFGISSPIPGIHDVASYGECMGNLARFLNDAKMPNGMRLPVIGFTGHNEPDGYGVETTATYYNAMISKVKAANRNYLIFGPHTTYAGALMPQFMQLVPDIDVVAWDMFPGGFSTTTGPGSQLWLGRYADRPADDIKTMVSRLSYRPQALMSNYNVDWNCASDDQHTYVGAIWSAYVTVQSINASPLPFWGTIWDAYGDGTCGFVPDPDNWATRGKPMVLTPFAYLMSQAVRKIHGPRWHVPVNEARLLICACTPSSGHCSLMIVNAGRGAQRNKTVALSHWPVNATGNGRASVWQLTNAVTRAGQDGTKSTIAVTAGVTAPLNFPDPSVTIISVS